LLPAGSPVVGFRERVMVRIKVWVRIEVWVRIKVWVDLRANRLGFELTTLPLY